MSLLINTIILTSLIGPLITSDTPGIRTEDQHISEQSQIVTGYSVLKLFLEDEQHLSTIRHAKMIITFSGISDSSSKLIDEISDSSEKALEKLEKIAQQKPSIIFEEYSGETIAKATFDSLRMTTAKEFIFDGEDFEKNILLSQLKVLRLISHLALELEKTEENKKRKTWLNRLSIDYENYYQRVSTHFTIQVSYQQRSQPVNNLVLHV